MEERLQTLISRLAEGDEGVRSSLSESLPESRILSLHVTDLDADYWTELASGRMSALQEGVHPDPDISIRSSSEDFIAILDGRKSILAAVLTGQVRIDASAADLMNLRRMA